MWHFTDRLRQDFFRLFPDILQIVVFDNLAVLVGTESYSRTYCGIIENIRCLSDNILGLRFDLVVEKKLKESIFHVIPFLGGIRNRKHHFCGGAECHHRVFPLDFPLAVMYPVGHGVPLAEPSYNRKNAVILDSHVRRVLNFRWTMMMSGWGK